MSWKDDQIVESGSWQNDPVVEEKTVMGALENTQKGLTRLADTTTDFLSPGPAMQRISQMSPSQSLRTVKDIAMTPINEAKRLGVGTLFKEGPAAAAKQFGQAAYDQPIETAMDLAGAKALGEGVIGMARKPPTIAPEAPNVAGMASDMPKAVPEAPLRSAVRLRGKTLSGEPGELHVDVIRKMAQQEGVPESEMFDTISKIGDQGFTQGDKFLSRQEASDLTGVKGEAASMRAAGKMDAPPPGAEGDVPLGATFQETVANLKKKLPGEVQQPLQQVEKFLSQKYQKLADNPSAIQNIGDMMERKSQSLRFKEAGAFPGQIKALKKGGMSEDQIRSLADWMDEKGITKPIRGYNIGKQIEKVSEEAGRTTGGIRKIATQRGAVHNPDTLMQSIRSELDSKYLKGGSASGEKGSYLKALQDIKNAPQTAEGIADAATELNRYGQKNKMTQPQGARTDVANVASRLNNDLIQKFLSPKEIESYHSARGDFGASKIADKFYANRLGRELAGRSSGLGGIWGETKNAIADIGGNKMMEKFFDRFGKKLKSNPEMAKNLGSLSDQAFSDILSALDEVIDETGIHK